MRLTISSLDSKEALTNIDKVYMDYVTSNLHASMCEKNKLRVYREFKEVFKCKKYLYGVPDMGSKLLFRFRSGTHGLNKELGRHITRKFLVICLPNSSFNPKQNTQDLLTFNVSKAFFFVTVIVSL